MGWERRGGDRHKVGMLPWSAWMGRLPGLRDLPELAWLALALFLTMLGETVGADCSLGREDEVDRGEDVGDVRGSCGGCFVGSVLDEFKLGDGRVEVELGEL